jgi:hypothetical protein
VHEQDRCGKDPNRQRKDKHDRHGKQNRRDYISNGHSHGTAEQDQPQSRSFLTLLDHLTA